MTLNANAPADTVLVSTLPGYIREDRAEINSIVAGTTMWGVSTVAVGGGQTTLAVGVELTDVPLEIVHISAAASETVDEITGGSDGHIKVFRFGDADVSFQDDGANIELNQLPAGGTFDGATGDFLVLLNVGGVPGSSDGMWYEIYRQVKV